MRRPVNKPWEYQYYQGWTEDQELVEKTEEWLGTRRRGIRLTDVEKIKKKEFQGGLLIVSNKITEKKVGFNC